MSQNFSPCSCCVRSKVLLTIFIGIIWIDSLAQSVVIYDRPEFRGRNKTLGVGNHRFFTNTGDDFNDIASSIKVPSGYIVVIYEHASETGGYGLSTDLIADCADLSKYRMNDKTSFIRVLSNRESPVGADFNWIPGAYVDGRYVPGHWQKGCKSPVGGNAGVHNPVLSPPLPQQIQAGSAKELHDILHSDFKGEVIIPKDVTYDMTGYTDLPVKSDVSIIGEKGTLGNRPTLLDSYLDESHNLFRVDGNNVRISGLRIVGPAADSRSTSLLNSIGITIQPEAGLSLERAIVISDNEILQWPGAAIRVKQDTIQEASLHHLVKYLGDTPDLNYVRSIIIERNFLHHNAKDGDGYGVVVGLGGFAWIEGNVFDYNRHAIAADGQFYSGYLARFNYVLEGGYTEQWGYYNQHFDVHGEGDGGYGGRAGHRYEIILNTFRGAQPYPVFGIRPAFMLRGWPDKGAVFAGNVTVHKNHDDAVKLKKGQYSNWLFEDHDEFNYSEQDNKFCVDHSAELATGEFDGDGRTDVFIANGTGWFISRAGFKQWEFLKSSTAVKEQLGFADINNDCITDVLYRDSEGGLGYFKGGKGNLIPLNTRSSALMKHLRFGDFNGDGLTDIFQSWDDKWYIWYGHLKDWRETQNSSRRVSDFLFGEFDNIKGTDIAVVESNRWAYSSGGVGFWTKLNDKLTGSFVNTVAGDFDGVGKTDIAWSKDDKWYYSKDGSGPRETLHSFDNGIYPFSKMLIGKFLNGVSTEVLSYNYIMTIQTIRVSGICSDCYGPTNNDDNVAFYGNQFVIWPGLRVSENSERGFVRYSEHNMR